MATFKNSPSIPGVNDSTSSPAGAVPELEDRDGLLGVVRETSRGGNEPAPEVNDRPDQNVGYDEAVKGTPLTPEERERAERESPLAGEP